MRYLYTSYIVHSLIDKVMYAENKTQAVKHINRHTTHTESTSLVITYRKTIPHNCEVVTKYQEVNALTMIYFQL